MTTFLYTVEQSQMIDKAIILNMSDDGYQLMQRAGQACYRHMMEYWSPKKSFTVYAGAGNNGGDAYIVAELLHSAGKQVKVVAIGDCSRLTGSAKCAYQAYINAGGTMISREDAINVDSDVIIDGILGSGLSRPLDNDLIELISSINRCDAFRFSIDVPTGINADTGCAMPIAIKSDITVTFIVRKQGLYTHDGKTFCGQLLFDDLQTDISRFNYPPSADLKSYRDYRSLFEERSCNTHKKMFGHILVIGGDYGMAGAVCLAGLSALRVGAGMVTVATRPEHARNIGISHPELMTVDVSDDNQFERVATKANVIVFGPGMIANEWGRYLLDRVIDFKLPTIADAGALRMIANKKSYFPDWILTPHPGEAADLLKISVKEVQNDRFAALEKICSQYAPSIILKGAGSLIGVNGRITICKGGNPAMSVAGMGDMLSGILGGLLGQKIAVEDALGAAVCVHNEAADITAEGITRGLLPSDLLPAIQQCVNPPLNDCI